MELSSDQKGIQFANATFTILVGFAFAIGGTAGSILVIVGIFWSFVRFNIPKVPAHDTTAVRMLALAGLLYYASGLLMVITNISDQDNYRLLWERLPFLGFLPLYRRYAISTPVSLKTLLMQTGALGGFVCGAWALYEIMIRSIPRAEGAAGNPGPFATICAVMFACACIGLVNSDKRWRFISAASAVAAAFAIVASGMRTLWPVIVLVPAIYLIWGANKRPSVRRIAILSMILVGVAGPLFTLGPGGDRVRQFASDLTASGLQPNANTSLGQRIAVWTCGAEIAGRHLFIGDGRQDAVEQMGECTLQSAGKKVQYSHFHNAAINAVAIGGIVELAATLLLIGAPLLIVGRKLDVVTEEQRLGRLLVVSIFFIFLLNGALNLMFGHDIMDTLYICFIAAALSLARNETNGSGYKV